jgi:hypothetical protein
MFPSLVSKDPIYVLNHCTKYLARDNTDSRHNYGQYSDDDPRCRISEAWRFPLIDSYNDGQDSQLGSGSNMVTFVHVNRDGRLGDDIFVLGTFADLYDPIPLKQIEDSIYWSVSVVVPKGQSHRYKFLGGSRPLLDPVNPQVVTLADGSQWSRFFTEYCTDMLCFESWEAAVLERLTDHILPFRTTEGQRFLNLYYKELDREGKATQYARAYRLDQPVGAVNFIDKLVARQEIHRLMDYKICLEQIDRVLRTWDPFEEPARMPSTAFEDLYGALASNDRSSLPGWDYNKYSSPAFFLQLLRRHTYTGAFSHPKHGGNSGAAGWSFLSANLVDPETGKLPDSARGPGYFDWSRALEAPLGRNVEYQG